MPNYPCKKVSTELVLTNDEKGQNNPVLSEKYLLWTNQTEIDDQELVIYDYQNNHFVRNTGEKRMWKNYQIYGDIIVFTSWDWRFDINKSKYVLDLSFYNISSGEIKLVSDSGAKPDIFQNKIVFTNVTYTENSTILYTDIVLYDLSISNYLTISEKNFTNGNPNIWGNYIVWEQYFNNNQSIILYDIIKKTIKRLTLNDSFSSLPRIFNSIVVWKEISTKEIDPQNESIIVYDIQTDEKKTILTTNNNINEIKIYNTNIIWTTEQKVFFHDLKNNDTLIVNQRDYISPAIDIWKNKIAYVAYYPFPHASTSEIHLITINSASGERGTDYTTIKLSISIILILLTLIVFFILYSKRKRNRT